MLCRARLASNRTDSDKGGGGFFTATWALACVFRPRVSLQVAVTVMGPAEVPDVSRVAVLPPPDTLPPLEVQPPIVTGALSGLVQVQLIVECAPA